jgi:copper chaperone CopZ
MQRLVLHIEGMSCGHCVQAVSGALRALPGVAVTSVRVGRAELEFDEGQTATETIVDAVTRAGYPASTQEAA